MWDEQFSRADDRVEEELSTENGGAAFNLMHEVLDDVWEECHRVLHPGGIVCINIGDATRRIGGEFKMFPNHGRIVQKLIELGFTNLPDIKWRKPTNAPNKFLGSGMLPAGAYVTYEHEYILIARKGSLRRFSPDDKVLRRRSAFFWEERNVWFADVWNGIKGVQQRIPKSKMNEVSRLRSAAFPLILPYRLILMHSIIGDTVLDPFLGTGTTTAAAIASGRSSIGYEIEECLKGEISKTIVEAVERDSYNLNRRRLKDHRSFVEADEVGRLHTGFHPLYKFPVATKCEEAIRLVVPDTLNKVNSKKFVVKHRPILA